MEITSAEHYSVLESSNKQAETHITLKKALFKHKHFLVTTKPPQLPRKLEISTLCQQHDDHCCLLLGLWSSLRGLPYFPVRAYNATSQKAPSSSDCAQIAVLAHPKRPVILHHHCRVAIELTTE